MKAILIDVNQPGIHGVEFKSNDDIYALLGCKIFESHEMPNNNLLLVDEEAYIQSQPKRFFGVCGRETKWAGNGLLVGVDGPDFCDYHPVEGLEINFLILDE